MLRAGASAMADVFTRNTTYSPPRQITIDSKYDGVPRIGIWVGYAVMVVSANGSRRVEVGPKTILLNYDETLEVLELSTGKPKTTDKLQRSVYLRVKNNKVSDIITAETSDQIPVSVKLSYRVNFDGDPNKWFEVENYVKFLCDHTRSKLKGEIRKVDIEMFSGDGVAYVRNILLGEKPVKGHRPLLTFIENGMTTSDVEVLDLKIENAEIAKMLHEAQYHAVSSNIALGKAEKQLSVTKRTEEITRETERTKSETQKLRAELEIAEVNNRLLVSLRKLESQILEIEQRADIAQKSEVLTDIAHESALAREQAQQKFKSDLALAASQLRLMELQAETNSVTERFKAAQAGFSEALLVLSNHDTLQKVVQAGSVQTIIGGSSLVDAIQKILVGTGLDEVGKKLVAGRLGNGAPAIPATRP
jgi:major vault protein